MTKIVFNKLLGGWYIVRGPHQTPLSGRFDTTAEAQASLEKRKIDRKVYAGKASRKEILRGMDMLRKSRAQADQ